MSLSPGDSIVILSLWLYYLYIACYTIFLATYCWFGGLFLGYTLYCSEDYMQGQGRKWDEPYKGKHLHPYSSAILQILTDSHEPQTSQWCWGPVATGKDTDPAGQYPWRLVCLAVPPLLSTLVSQELLWSTPSLPLSFLFGCKGGM